MVLELFKEAVEREMLENWDQSWMWYGLGWGGGCFLPRRTSSKQTISTGPRYMRLIRALMAKPRQRDRMFP